MARAFMMIGLPPDLSIADALPAIPQHGSLPTDLIPRFD
jgi:hypothetical protein